MGLPVLLMLPYAKLLKCRKVKNSREYTASAFRYRYEIQILLARDLCQYFL